MSDETDDMAEQKITELEAEVERLQAVNEKLRVKLDAMELENKLQRENLDDATTGISILQQRIMELVMKMEMMEFGGADLVGLLHEVGDWIKVVDVMVLDVVVVPVIRNWLIRVYYRRG